LNHPHPPSVIKLHGDGIDRLRLAGHQLQSLMGIMLEPSQRFVGFDRRLLGGKPSGAGKRRAASRDQAPHP
jgi:hypothetical protein